MPADFSLAALIPARLLPFSASGVLQDDLVDFTATLRQSWEIKPVMSSTSWCAPRDVVPDELQLLGHGLL